MRVTAALVAMSIACGGVGATAAPPATTTFGAAGKRAVDTLLRVLYADGQWQKCVAPGCGTSNTDWGVDSLTYALHLRWSTAHDESVVRALRQLVRNAPRYGAPCTDACASWSDVPEWDAIAAVREYEATHDPQALENARAAFEFVEHATVYEIGACPRIRYQQPSGRANHLKTLETDANAIKAALLLFRWTGSPAYLHAAIRRYASVRAYFLDPKVPLYSVYVFDDGRSCEQVPHRFFASVNGDMIWSGVELQKVTGRTRYLRDAVATGKAVDRYLSDPNGVFVDLQAENDIVEPLVEGMYALAKRAHEPFARRWILRNAAAALSARAADGTFGRFFDGPAPVATRTAWQTNGGLALMIAAAALAPKQRASTASWWRNARYVANAVPAAPASISFDGAGIALVGALGDVCCEPGHARVFVDGRETFDGTGIWQNKSSAGIRVPNTILFVWRWPKRGRHTISFEPGVPNAKEGGPYLHLDGYLVR